MCHDSQLVATCSLCIQLPKSISKAIFFPSLALSSCDLHMLHIGSESTLLTLVLELQGMTRSLCFAPVPEELSVMSLSTAVVTSLLLCQAPAACLCVAPQSWHRLSAVSALRFLVL